MKLFFNKLSQENKLFLTTFVKRCARIATYLIICMLILSFSLSLFGENLHLFQGPITIFLVGILSLIIGFSLFCNIKNPKISISYIYPHILAFLTIAVILGVVSVNGITNIKIYGDVFEVDTAIILVGLVLVVLFGYLYTKKHCDVHQLLLSLSISVSLTFVLVLLGAIGGIVELQKILTNAIDLSIILGIGTISALFCSFSLISRWMILKRLLLSFSILELGALAVLSQPKIIFIIVPLHLTLLFFLIRQSSKSSKEYQPYKYAMFLILILLSLGVGGYGIRVMVPDVLSIGNTAGEVRPSFRSTLHTILLSYESEPKTVIFGAGPGSFKDLWALHKPIQVARSAFGEKDFSYGSNLFFTLFIIYGVPFMLSIIFLVGFLLFLFWNSLERNVIHTDYSFIVVVLLFILIIYSTLINIPSIEIMIIGGLLAGTITAFIRRVRTVTQPPNISIRRLWLIRSLTIFISISLIVGSAHLLFTSSKRVYALELYVQARDSINDGIANDDTFKFATTSLDVDYTPLVARFLLELYKIQFLGLANGSVNLSDKEKDEYSKKLNEAVVISGSLVEKQNYFRNLIIDADLVALFGILSLDEGKIKDSLGMYERAQSMSPYNIKSMVSKIELLVLLGKYDEAKELLFRAELINPNFPSVKVLHERLN
jgi:hypothetical protein